MKAPEQSIALLSLDRETKIMIEPIHTAYKNNTEKQLSGIFSSLQLPFNKIYTKEIFWIMFLYSAIIRPYFFETEIKIME